MRYHKFGLLEYDAAQATPGYTIFTPIHADNHTTYLLDMNGEVVHEWDVSDFRTGYGKLLPNGNLLTVLKADLETASGREGMRIIHEFDWDGNIVWQCDAPAQHHDFHRLPNGNTVYLGFERFRPDSIARLQGGVPGTEMPDGGVLGDYICEVNMTGETVWEWHAQDEMEIENYPIHPLSRRDEFCHANSLFPLANGDYLISFRRNSWIFIIDRKTKKVRWEKNDYGWGGQHDAQVLDNGNIMLFANGQYGESPTDCSRVIEFNPETGVEAWRYEGDPPYTFFSQHISGAQRLWSGNTLICEGLWGRIFEVTPDGEIVWEYISSHFGPCGPASADKPSAIANWVFRAYRYAPDSPEINGRLPG
jgi:outer membrane protein assembly factor BamB